MEKLDVVGFRIDFLDHLQWELKSKLYFCKKCEFFKPPRTHHCSSCDKCILKMDHHCVWLKNCVGFNNYKFFFLGQLYQTIACTFSTSTYILSVIDIMSYKVSAVGSYYVGYKVWVLITILFIMMFNIFVLVLWLFHSISLASKNRTTIEYRKLCMNKKTPDQSESEHKKSQENIYDLGFVNNLRAFLGKHCFVWWIPANLYVIGDGTSFDTRKKNDMEVKLYLYLLIFSNTIFFKLILNFFSNKIFRKKRIVIAQ